MKWNSYVDGKYESTLEYGGSPAGSYGHYILLDVYPKWQWICRILVPKMAEVQFNNQFLALISSWFGFCHQ